MPVRILRFKIIFLYLAIFVFACGPKPKVQIRSDGSPQSVWDAFYKHFVEHRSAAIKGHITAYSKGIYECDFEAFYIKPDSLSFVANGPFGVNIARIVLVGDSGFIEIPQKKIFEQICRDDVFYFEEINGQFSIGMLFRSIFFTQVDGEYNFKGQTKKLYFYRHENNLEGMEIFLDKRTCYPQEKSIIDDKDTVRVNYSNWRISKHGFIYPRNIKITSSETANRLDLKIGQAAVDIDVPKAKFASRLNHY